MHHSAWGLGAAPPVDGRCLGRNDPRRGGEISQDVTGAIVGGTGKYEGATGSFTSKSLGGGETTDTFSITLP
jgi:hypothetical protein